MWEERQHMHHIVLLGNFAVPSDDCGQRTRWSWFHGARVHAQHRSQAASFLLAWYHHRGWRRRWLERRGWSLLHAATSHHWRCRSPLPWGRSLYADQGSLIPSFSLRVCVNLFFFLGFSSSVFLLVQTRFRSKILPSSFGFCQGNNFFGGFSLEL